MRREHMLIFALLALGQGALLAAGETPAYFAAPPISASGCSGLVRIPTADISRYGDYVLGVNVVDGSHRVVTGKNTVAHFASFGILPQVEVTARITNFDGNLGVQFRDALPGMPMGGWNFDRSVGIHVQLLPQTARWPIALAVGHQDVTGNDTFAARYLVASRRWPRVGVHLGVGDGKLGAAFGGVDYQASESVRLLLDHDGSRANIGCAVRWRHVVLTPFLTGLSSLGGGVAYEQRL